jgi:predicted transcriptional regulator
MANATERPTSFWIDDESRALLQEISKETGMSRSAVVREAIKGLHGDRRMAKVRRLVNELHQVVSGG